MKNITLLFFATLVATLMWIPGHAQFTESFDTEIPSDWTVIDNDGQGETWEFSTTNPYLGAGSAHLLYEINAHDDYLITPQFTVTSGVSDQVSFYATANSTYYEETFDVKLSTTGTAPSDFTEVLGSEITSTNDYVQFVYSIPLSYAGQDVYVAVVGTSTNQFHFYLDEFSVGAGPTCPAPSDLAVSGITTDSADITWTESGNATQWDVVYGTPGFDPDMTGTLVNVNVDPETTLSGLDDSTAYDVYVRSVCDINIDESTFTGPMSFTTLCDPIDTLPYTEDFDTYGTGSDAFPSCWLRPVTYTASTVWPSIVSLNATSSPNSLQFQSLTDTPTYAVSPSFEEDIHNLRVSFMLKREGTSSGTMDIGVMADPLDINTFELVQTINPADNNHTEYIFDLNNTFLEGGNRHIALRHNSVLSSWFYWVDDFKVEPIPSCPAPTNFSIDGVTETTADISWTLGDSETSWNISWGTPGYTPGDNDEISTDTASTTSYQITNLAADTAYDVYVQADCGGEESTWVGPLEVYTGYCIPTTTGSLAYIDDFTATGDSGQDISNIGSGSSLDGNGYSDFTNLPAIQATASSDVDFTVEIGSGSNTAGLRMWVDWGQNLSFGDQSSGEEVYASNSYEGTHTGTFTIPANASGTYRLRVGASYIPSSGPDDPCGLANSGEYEDYLLEVIAFSGYVYESGAWTPGDPSGVSTDSDNVLVIDGTASLTADTDVNNLTIMDGATLNINNVLNLHGDLTIDGDLVFVSNETGNGELGPVAASSIISGVATVQNYMSHNRSYRMVASSVVTSTSSIHAHWQEGATSSMDDPAPGFGTHITGSTTDQDNGFDATATGNPSMFTVDLANQEFEPIGNTDASYLAPGDGYLLFVRGDRSIDLTDNTSVGETVLRTKGYLATGAGGVNFATVNAGDFAMFGNPYQSAVDINSIFGNGGTSNINSGFYYVYDPTIGTHGAYVTVTLPAGTSTATSSANKYLQPGQGAQFATSANGASELEFTEANKAPGQFTTTSATGNNLFSDNMLTVQLFTTENFSNGGSEHDSFGIIFGDGLDNEITNADARKPMNFYENFGRDHNGTYLSIERREMPVPAEVYPLYSSGYNYADYTLKMNIDGLEDTFLYLDDHYTGTSTLLEGSDTVYTFSVDANNELSIATDRFSVRVEQRLGIDNNGLLAGVRLFPNPLNDNTFYINAPKLNGEQISVSISDLSGRQIFENMLDCRANTVTVSVNDNLASGVYLVTLRHGGEENTYRLVKK